MTMASDTRPVGPRLDGWTAPDRPGPPAMHGRYVRLEQLDPATHGGALFAALGQVPEVWTYLSLPPFDTATALTSHLEELTQDPEGPVFYAIVPEGARTSRGFFSYYTIQPAVGVIELGYVALGPELQRTRAATEAVFLMMDWAFEAGYRRFEWKCDTLNAPSRRAASRFGFQFEGVFRQAMVVKGRNRDTAWYSVVDGEWPALRAAFMRWLDPGNFDAAGMQRSSLSSLTAR